MSAATEWVNPEILSWARTRLNLTHSEVAEESKKLARRHYAAVSVERLTAWEQRREDPDLEHLETLAEIYVCPVGYFFLESRPAEGLPLSFRGVARSPTDLGSSSHRALRRFSELTHWTVDLLRKTEQPWQVSVRPGQVAPQVDAAEELAIEYRQRLGWTAETRRKFDGKFREAFRWWRRTIEAQGVFCLEMRLDPNDVRGAALWCEGYPFILVNHQDIEAAAGRIFTLLHEFAHLIVTKEGVACDFQGVHGGSGGQNPEPFANRFAARILLTPDELRRRLESIGEARYREQWPDALLERIRKPFAASRDVVAILLQDIGLAPRGLYNEKREQWKSKRSWGRGGHRPPLQEQKLQEFGYSLAGVLAHSVAHPGFSWMDASSVLGLKVEKTQKFLAWADEHLT